MSHTFTAFGLTFQSNVSIPGFPAESTRTAPLAYIEIQPTKEAFTGNYVSEFTSANGIQFLFERGGGALHIVRPEGVPLEEIADYLQGSVLRRLLRLGGMFCFHATAVSLRDQAILLVGREGCGKSTLAAALLQQGFSFLSEDIVSCYEQDQHFCIAPGLPWIRLRPDSLELLNQSGFGSVLACPTWDQLYYDLRTESNQPSTRLSLIFLLDRSETTDGVQVRPAAKKESFFRLTESARVGDSIGKNLNSDAFFFLCRLVEQTPARHLIIGKQAPLRSVCNEIIGDFECLPLPATAK